MQKQNFSSSPFRRQRSGDENDGPDELTIYPYGYAAMLQRFPPPVPPALLRRIGIKELSGIGKVKVMLRVSSRYSGSFFSADKRKKQVMLIDPSSGQWSTAEDRKPTVSAPKIFAFDAIFTEEDSQTEICSNALTDIIHAVINGTDGCLFCFGYAGLGKTYTMLGTAEAGHTLGAIPCAITWLFHSINEQRQKTGARFSVRVSCLELITIQGQQQIKDLLTACATDSEQVPSTYFKDDSPFGKLQLQQHSELRASTAERAAFYLDVATAARQHEDCDTHMLYTLHVYQYSVASKGGVAGGRSRLHLIDIGNSDRGKSSGSIPLSGLGNVLLAIFNGQKHLPYKEHMITQLLKECLSSLTCHATMIAHVSPNAQQYAETLTTCQLASRIHRMRRRKIRFVSGSTQNNGSGGSSGDEVAKQNSECDPSSSDMSADTVIYIGPSAEDATDGEHPPVYIPSLNSEDNRCAMSSILQNSSTDKLSKVVEEQSPVYKTTKFVRTLSVSKQTSSSIETPKASPARKTISKVPTSKILDSSSGKISVPVAAGAYDEQWVDGPRISKSKVAEARHLLKDTAYKKETWIDGPMQQNGSAQSIIHVQQHSTGYGFMDSHKRSMIRKWVENQSSHIRKSKYLSSNSVMRQPSHVKIFKGSTQWKESTVFKISSDAVRDHDDDFLSTNERESLEINDKKIGAKVNFLNVRSNADPGLDPADSPLMNSLKRLNKNLDTQEDEDDDEEIVVPPPLPLIKPLSNGVSRDVSIESSNPSHRDIVSSHPSRYSLSSDDDIFEIIKVNEADQVPKRDSCLQVTEEDIARCMKESSVSENERDEHPLRILSQENLTVISTFTDSLSVLSETERYKLHFSTPEDKGKQLRQYFDHEDFLVQENRFKFDQLARLHELYQSELALANVTNSLTYQREKIFVANVEKTSSSSVFHPPSRCQSLSLSDGFFNDTASTHGSIYSEPAYVAENKELYKICDNCRQSMNKPATATFWYPSSVDHLDSTHRFCERLADHNILNLRHPDGASNPHLEEEIERIPGNGASGSDPEEEYIEAKKLFATSTTDITFLQQNWERSVTGESNNEEEMKINGLNSIITPASVPFSIPSSARMQRKISSLDSSLGLNKDDYDSGADSTSRAAKLSPATLSRHRAESSGYDSIVRDSETSSIDSDSSRQTSVLQEHHSGALGILTSTLCGCFSGGTSGRVRAPGQVSITNRSNYPRHRIHANPGEVCMNLRTLNWHNVQDTLSLPEQAPS